MMVKSSTELSSLPGDPLVRNRRRGARFRREAWPNPSQICRFCRPRLSCEAFPWSGVRGWSQTVSEREMAFVDVKHPRSWLDSIARARTLEVTFPYQQLTLKQTGIDDSVNRLYSLHRCNKMYLLLGRHVSEGGSVSQSLSLHDSLHVGRPAVLRGDDAARGRHATAGDRDVKKNKILKKNNKNRFF